MIRGAGKRGLAAGLEELEELPGALLAPVDSEVEYRMLNSLKQYEIAFFGSNAMTITALPEQLFPLALNWKDASGAPQRLVIATSKETDRRAWKVCIRNLCLQDGMHRKAIGWSNGRR
ncbi:unnamed protein product [Effrenium voratum]|nr:unnamed protein product [Effrenium voratum]